MRTLGRVTRADLAALQQRGVAPQRAVSVLLAEARERYPRAGTVIIQPAVGHDGFDILEVGA